MNSELGATPLNLSVNMLLQSMLEFFREFQIHPETEFRDSGTLKTILTGVPHPILNAVLQSSFDPDTLDADIQKTIHIFGDKALPFSWYVWPNSSPNNLGERLEANGLTHTSSSPGMIADLSRLPNEVPWAEGLEIKMVSSKTMLADWIIPIDQSFQLPEFVSDFFVYIFTSLGLDETKPTRHFVAYLDGKPTASSTLYLGSDRVAGIWNVATTADSRGKGIGTAVTWKPLQKAVKEGYTHAILRSSEMGYNVYKRLGFEEAFKDKVYLWTPPEQQT